MQPSPRCQVDESIERVVIGDMKFPLGVYPVEPMEPRQGYAVEFEPADGGEDDDTDVDDPTIPDADWEHWPDRYVYDIVITSERVPALVRHLLALMPGRAFPILDFIGHDAYREIDPYISYVLMGVDRFVDAIRRYRPFFFEDGMCGFGLMSDDPFFYLFIDEHKIVTVRTEPDLKEKVERVLEAFDLQRVPEPLGADAATHEHRGVLVSPDDHPEFMGAEEIVEQLRAEWRLTLNIDPDTNLDEDGHDLGLTSWRCLLRCERESEDRPRYAEVILFADCLAQAEELAFDAVAALLADDGGVWTEPMLLAADRTSPEQHADLVREPPAPLGAPPPTKAGPKPATTPRRPAVPTIVRAQFLE